MNEEFVADPDNVKVAILSIGGESDTDSGDGGNKTAYDIMGEVALRYNAPIYTLEHRFYGKSQPFADDENPLSTEYLKYLSSRYEIQDLVAFQAYIDKQFCEKNGAKYIHGKTCVAWMIAGGSYAGAVAAWISQQHPHLFAATVSSSGVVDAHYELPEFDTHTFAAGGVPCSRAIQQALREIERVTEDGNDTYLQFFDALNAKSNLEDFYYFLADATLMSFQYGHYKDTCPEIVKIWNNGEDPTDYIVNYIKQQYKYITYDRDYLKTTTEGHQRQWWYQTCTEVAYFQPAAVLNNVRSPRVTTQWHLDICKYAFGLDLGDPTDRTNKYYGNRALYAPNTFFSNFWQDVWHLCGVTEAQARVSDNQIGYINCRDCGHCVDLHTYADSDVEQLVELRKKELDFVSGRIDAYLER